MSYCLYYVLLGIYFDVTEIQPVVKGTFRFNGSNEKVCIVLQSIYFCFRVDYIFSINAFSPFGLAATISRKTKIRMIMQICFVSSIILSL